VNLIYRFTIACTALLTALLITSSFVPVANAQIPVTDIAHIVETTLGVSENTITALEQTLSTGNQLYAFFEKFAIAGMKKEILDTITDQIVKYVQGGGEPKFVKNWGDFFGQARLSGAGSIASALQGVNLCDNFGDSLKSALGEGTGGLPPIDFNPNALACDFAPGELADFHKDFNNGGWDAYLKTLQPNNDALSVYSIAKNAQSKAAYQAQEAAKSEAIAGGGFLSARQINGGIESITTPGSLIKDLTARAAATDIDFVANTDELEGLLGAAINGIAKELTSPGDSGLSGVNLARRQRTRIDAADTESTRINPDGTRNLADQSDCDAMLEDSNGDGRITQVDIDNAALNDGPYALYQRCVSNLSTLSHTQNRKQQLLLNISNVANTLRSAKLAMSNLDTKIRALNGFSNIVNGEQVLDPNRNCLNTDGTPKQGRKYTTADKTAGLTKDTIERSIETGNSFDPARAKWLPCLVEGETRTITYNDKNFLVDGYDTYKRNISTLVELRTEVRSSVSKLGEFRAQVSVTSEDALDYTISPPLSKMSEFENEFALGDQITNDPVILSASVPSVDPSAYGALNLAIRATTPSDPDSTSVLIHPEYNLTRAGYILALASDEVNTVPADQDATGVPTDTLTDPAAGP
jgi:hypothetical protein